MSSLSHALPGNAQENDPLRGFASARLRLARPSALSLLAEVLDTIEDAFCVCDSAGRIQHENPAFRQVITRTGEIERVRTHVRALAREATAAERDSASRSIGMGSSSRSAEFSVGDVSYRLRVSLLRTTAADHSAAALLSLEVRSEAPVPDHFRRRHRLTPREAEVVKLLAEGHSNKSVANSLGVSVHTARHHVARVLAKLEASGRAEVGALLRRLHW